jgi:hypothetical protein
MDIGGLRQGEEIAGIGGEDVVAIGGQADDRRIDGI